MSNPSGSERTTDQVLEHVDLAGRSVFVTGASSGLGAETARALAARGAAVTLAARDLAKLDAVAPRIGEQTGNRNLEVAALDLGPEALARLQRMIRLASTHAVTVLKQKRSIVIASFGQRSAHSAQRMQSSSSFRIADTGPS